MRVPTLCYGARPRLAKPPRQNAIPNTRYTTLATRARIPSRLILHPTLFLLHLTGITCTSMLVPLIGSRLASNRAVKAESDQLPLDTTDDPPPEEPRYSALQPSQRQLRKLSSVLRTQIASASHGFDALFTLRQLHLFRPPAPPQIPPFSPNRADPSEYVLLPEKWLWRLPATAAIHAAIRGGDLKMMETAVTLALNALSWDSLIWQSIELQKAQVREMELSKPGVYDVVSPDGFSLNRPRVRVVLDSDAHITSQHRHLAATPSPSDAFPLSSLSITTLETLFLFLARHPDRSQQMATYALQLSFAISKLGIPLSSAVHWHTVRICRAFGRVDLACLAWERWVERVQMTGEDRNEVQRAYSTLRDELRPYGREFASRPSLKILAAVSHLARMLDRQANLLQDSTLPSRYSPVADLVHLLTRFPTPVKPTSMQLGGSRHSNDSYRSHLQLSAFVDRVLVQLLGKVIGAPIFRLETGYEVVGLATAPSVDFHAKVGVSTRIYASLLAYALKTLESHTVATHLLDRIPPDELRSSPVIANLLLTAVNFESKPEWRDPDQPPENNRTIPSLVAYLTRISQFIELDKLVFTILPELDNQNLHARESSTPFVPSPDNLYPPRAIAPPPGRTPHLYTTLLNALRKAGRTGLAERVFRSARWAASLSRKPIAAENNTNGENGVGTREGNRGWVLPPAIFTIMLQLYAAEAKKPTPLQQREEEGDESNPYVVGWGRDALRVFFIRREQESARRDLGPNAEVRGRRDRRSRVLPNVLRAQAAPIVSRWELEGGSEPPELASLAEALASPFAKKAVETLFPGTSPVLVDGERLHMVRSRRRTKSRRSERLERRMREALAAQKQRRADSML